MPYTKDNMYGISIAIIFGGVVLVMVGAPCLFVCSLSGFYRDAGSPVWTGIIAVVTGSSGIYMAKNEKVESMSFTFLLLNILVIVCALFSMVLSAIGAYWEATIAILYESGGLVLYILVELAGLVVLIISGIAACMYWCGVGERQMLMNQQQQHLKAKMSGFSRVVPPRAQPAAFYVQGQVQVTVPPGTKLTGQDNGSSDIPVGGNQVPPEYISLQNPPEYKKAPQAEEGV